MPENVSLERRASLGPRVQADPSQLQAGALEPVPQRGAGDAARAGCCGSRSGRSFGEAPQAGAAARRKAERGDARRRADAPAGPRSSSPDRGRDSLGSRGTRSSSPSSPRSKEGSGLGLATVHRHRREHGGMLQVGEPPGTGHRVPRPAAAAGGGLVSGHGADPRRRRRAQHAGVPGDLPAPRGLRRRRPRATWTSALLAPRRRRLRSRDHRHPDARRRTGLDLLREVRETLARRRS